MIKQTQQQKSTMMTKNGFTPEIKGDSFFSPSKVLVIALVLATSGCAYVKPRPLVDTQTSALPTAPTAPAPNGAIFQSAQPAY